MPRMVPSVAEAAPCGPKICMSSKHIDIVMQQTSSSYYYDCEIKKLKRQRCAAHKWKWCHMHPKMIEAIMWSRGNGNIVDQGK